MSSRSLHIVICNERLLPRYGVDRLLLLLGTGLRAAGHRITLLCQRCDRRAAESVSSSIVELPHLGRTGFLQAEHNAAHWLSANWQSLAPDVVITGGWPFFGIAEVCAAHGTPSIFIDAGAVPHDGMPAHSVTVQRLLRGVRAKTLPRFTAVLPISAFIRSSQTIPDRGTEAGVHTVPLGADHMETPLFGVPADGASIAHAALARQADAPLVLLLGRFETGSYKNSLAAFDVFALILARVPQARLLILAQPEDVSPPEAIAHAVIPVGFPDDAGLRDLMARCTAGLSVSLWEGFNLPLAEMQHCRRPVLAFALGAHPEVIADPWFLCGGIAEMADKAIRLLTKGVPPHLDAQTWHDRFRDTFRWSETVARCRRIIEDLAVQSPLPQSAASRGRVIFVDCTNAAVDPTNPGVIRVARRLCHALEQNPDLRLIFVRWDARTGTYRLLTAPERATLGTYDGPHDAIAGLFASSGTQPPAPDDMLALLRTGTDPVLFLPEVALDGRMPERLAWARARAFRVAAILYDLIPVTHMPFCAPDVVARFPEYLEGLATADAIWADSAETLHAFERHVARHSLARPPQREAIWLPAQFGAVSRATSGPRPKVAGEALVALCIGSIEPRKNLRRLIEAFRAFLTRRPDVELHLVLAGNRFGGADALATWVRAITQQEPRITWTEMLSDPALARLLHAADFTIYPSLVEGFGLPIAESLWMGRPCLCHDAGTMAELAAAGGCLTADMADPAAIGHAIERLATDTGLRQRLTAEALARPLRDWAAYAAEIGARLQALGGAAPVQAPLRRDSLDDRIRAEAESMRGLGLRFVDATDVAA